MLFTCCILGVAVCSCNLAISKPQVPDRAAVYMTCFLWAKKYGVDEGMNFVIVCCAS